MTDDKLTLKSDPLNEPLFLIDISILKIIFDEFKAAVAVQFDRFSLSYLVYVRKEVIVSGGAINSPQILMLSGIGPANHLKSFGVRLVN